MKLGLLPKKNPGRCHEAKQAHRNHGPRGFDPLTEYILSQMGEEGAEIRKRLKKFYRRRALVNLPFFKEHMDKSA
jgi:hypothetical protein